MSKEVSIKVRLPDELAKRIDAFADDEFMTRSEGVRELLTRGLAFGRKVLSGPEARKLIDDVIREAMKP